MAIIKSKAQPIMFRDRMGIFLRNFNTDLEKKAANRSEPP